MTGVRRWTSAVTVALFAATTVLPAAAFGDVVSTRISFRDFKRAFDVRSIRRLLDPNTRDGITFFTRKLDSNGNPVDFTDPNHAAVDQRKSFMVFRVDTSVLPQDTFSGLEALIARLQFRGTTDPENVGCGLGGSRSAGVIAVSCAVGTSVSPS